MKKIFLVFLISTLSYCISLHKLPSDGNPVGIKDERTGIIWQKCQAGDEQENCKTLWDEAEKKCENVHFFEQEDCRDSYFYLNWKQAVAYCDSKGGGWRLPTVSELLANFDYPNADFGKGLIKRIGPVAFPEEYWSSDSYEFDSSKAWILNRARYPTLKSKVTRYRVRCVSN